MNIIKFIFLPAYRMGWQDNRIRGFVPNPYTDKAIEDNYARGLGGSPHWETEYRPFINWEQGRSDWNFDRWVKDEYPKHKKEDES